MSRLWAVEVWTRPAASGTGDHGINICEDYATVERLRHFHERRGDRVEVWMLDGDEGERPHGGGRV